MTPILRSNSGIKVIFQVTDTVNYENRQNFCSTNVANHSACLQLASDTLQSDLDTCHKIFGKNFSVEYNEIGLFPGILDVGWAFGCVITMVNKWIDWYESSNF